MTTMELIEKGIGHNCLSDAYELGKRDAFKAMSPRCNYRHFAFDRDSYCSGYFYCMLKGFDSYCCCENCKLMGAGSNEIN